MSAKEEARKEPGRDTSWSSAVEQVPSFVLERWKQATCRKEEIKEREKWSRKVIFVLTCPRERSMERGPGSKGKEDIRYKSKSSAILAVREGVWKRSYVGNSTWVCSWGWWSPAAGIRWTQAGLQALVGLCGAVPSHDSPPPHVLQSGVWGSLLFHVPTWNIQPSNSYSNSLLRFKNVTGDEPSPLVPCTDHHAAAHPPTASSAPLASSPVPGWLWTGPASP